MPDYSNSCIYKLCCKDPSVNESYVGSTTNFKRRKHHHKCRCCNEESNYYVYQFIREHGGWDNWDMVLLEKVSVNDKLELSAKEREWFEKLGSKLNSQVPNRTRKERLQDDAERVTERNKNYKLVNKEKISKQNKKYRLQNREEIAQRVAEWSCQKITCECGLIINRSSLTKHLKSEKHAKLMAQLNEE